MGLDDAMVELLNVETLFPPGLAGAAVGAALCVELGERSGKADSRVADTSGPALGSPVNKRR